MLSPRIAKSEDWNLIIKKEAITNILESLNIEYFLYDKVEQEKYSKGLKKGKH